MSGSANSDRETEDYSATEEEEDDFLAYIPEDQRDKIKQSLANIQSQFRTFNVNQKHQKVADVLSHVPDISEDAAQLAIDSCRNNELLAIKRLLEDADFKTTVVAMSSGEMPIDLPSIMYKDKRHELLEALEWDPEEREDKDDKENWELSSSSQLLYDLDLPSPSSRRRSPTANGGNGGNSGNSGNSSSAGSEGKDRKVPRLSLDDALIMLANLRTRSPVETPPSPDSSSSPVSPVRPKRRRAEAASEDDEYSDSEPRKKRSSIQSRGFFLFLTARRSFVFPRSLGSRGENDPSGGVTSLGVERGADQGVSEPRNESKSVLLSLQRPGRTASDGEVEPEGQGAVSAADQREGRGLPSRGYFWNSRKVGYFFETDPRTRGVPVQQLLSAVDQGG
ncbi:uncharacterized protein [Blastocystis hominis]|uniref:Uncharacterized protein n=1 Tax=Blastocystis hominis TaxID=12968 RepID=D8M3P8_BLAHO|nr:uncharacterized protein [Blastocystis hominis]CBK22521.2 unnamed protein product [Blastocystis hominis]|eukprot:XP_012896569.1 uncharacterized protein [Blastocystis hominis]